MFPTARVYSRSSMPVASTDFFFNGCTADEGCDTFAFEGIHSGCMPMRGVLRNVDESRGVEMLVLTS